MSETIRPALTEALRLAALGYRVFPCRPGEKRPATIHGVKDATSDAEQIRRWFGNGTDFNLGLDATGLVVIDVDDPSGEWLAEHSEHLHPGAEAITPRKGRHLFFRRPEGKAWGISAGKLAPKIDIRTDGGYVCVWPSKTEAGEYAWDRLLDVPKEQLPELHAWAGERMDALSKPPQAAPVARQPSPPSSSDSQRAAAYVAAVPGSGEGSRNADLNGLSYRLVERFLLTESEHLDLCLSWAARCSPPMSEQEARQTAASAWRGAHSKQAVGQKRTEPIPPRRPVAPPAEESAVSSNVTDCDQPPHPAETEPATPVLRAHDLLAYNTDHDPNCLLGRRWICRGGSAIWVGQAGLGKSSLLTQAACMWALGRDFFGIKPAFPLRSVIVQAENDQGDLSESFKGVVNGLGLSSEIETLQQSIVWASRSDLTGKNAISFFRRLALAHRPDLFWVDPLLSFLGGDVSSQETVSSFLRNGLTPISQELGLAWQIIHHTNKPPRDPTLRNGYVGQDYSYLGTGSAELANWPRASVILREPEEKRFELRLAKRGPRAGMTDCNGVPATEIPIQYGGSGVVWERAMSDSVRYESKIESSVAAALAKMNPDETYKATALVEIVAGVFGYTSKRQVYRGIANEVYEEIKRQTKCAGLPHLFRKCTNLVT